MKTHAILKEITACLLLLALAFPSFAQPTQNWRPTKPVRLVVGFAAGGGSDTVARLIAPKLATALGQSVVVENRPGGGGILAADTVAKSSPDGSTWLLAPSAHATSAAMRKSLPYQTDRTWRLGRSQQPRVFSRQS